MYWPLVQFNLRSGRHLNGHAGAIANLTHHTGIVAFAAEAVPLQAARAAHRQRSVLVAGQRRRRRGDGRWRRLARWLHVPMVGDTIQAVLGSACSRCAGGRRAGGRRRRSNRSRHNGGDGGGGQRRQLTAAGRFFERIIALTVDQLLDLNFERNLKVSVSCVYICVLPGTCTLLPFSPHHLPSHRSPETASSNSPGTRTADGRTDCRPARTTPHDTTASAPSSCAD